MEGIDLPMARVQRGWLILVLERHAPPAGHAHGDAAPRTTMVTGWWATPRKEAGCAEQVTTLPVLATLADSVPCAPCRAARR